MWLLNPVDASAGPLLTTVVAEGEPESLFPGGDGATLSLLLVGEHEGLVGSCGCKGGDRGGLPRFGTLVEARSAEPTPLLTVHAGAFLASSGEGTALSVLSTTHNTAFLEALPLVGFDVLGATFRDVPGLSSADLATAVSATHRETGSSIPREATFERGGVRVVVTSVSREGPPWLLPEGATTLDPVAALADVPREDGDLVVVLAYDHASRVDELARLPGVDVVVDTAAWNGRYEPRTVGDAVVVRTRDEGWSATELRLTLVDGRVSAATERVLPLTSAIRQDRAILRYADR